MHGQETCFSTEKWDLGQSKNIKDNTTYLSRMAQTHVTWESRYLMMAMAMLPGVLETSEPPAAACKGNLLSVGLGSQNNLLNGRMM